MTTTTVNCSTCPVHESCLHDIDAGLIPYGCNMMLVLIRTQEMHDGMKKEC